MDRIARDYKLGLSHSPIAHGPQTQCSNNHTVSVCMNRVNRFGLIQLFITTLFLAVILLKLFILFFYLFCLKIVNICFILLCFSPHVICIAYQALEVLGKGRLIRLCTGFSLGSEPGSININIIFKVIENISVFKNAV